MIVTKTPFRISFVGGGTDIGDYYHTGHGSVVSAGINKYMYITLNKRFDDTVRVSYTQTEIVEEANMLRHDLVREAMKMAGVTRGVEITSISDIPAGTGLGSSSSLTVGVLNALYSYTGERISAYELAVRACEIEINVLKHPIGKQDQFAAAFGGINYFQFNADESVECKKIRLPEEDYKKTDRKLMLYYTGISRSADDILAEQKKQTAMKKENLDYMRDQAEIMYQLLAHDGFTEQFGSLLHEGWLRKKSITDRISNPTIDEAYEKALAAGAVGGKLLGAGGGGFLLLYCDEENQEAVRESIGLWEMDFRISRYGSRVVYFA